MSDGNTLPPTGIIDIGSNSVRFVAYGGCRRVPSILFNEKIMAELGRGVAADGRLEAQSVAATLGALARFRSLAEAMKLARLETVATAATRDASNGPEFLDAIRALGLNPQLIPGAEEAELAGYGVVSGIPQARGIVADLGGGSLELIPVGDGQVGKGLSLPLGVLRLGDRPVRAELAATIRTAIAAAGKRGKALAEAGRGHGLYLVGGSFRALASLDLRLSASPLPIVHHHRLTAQRLAELKGVLRRRTPEELKAIPGLSSARVPQLPRALVLLQALVDVLAPDEIVTSSFGLREGMLFRALDEAQRGRDPLLADALHVGERLGRFGDHGHLLDRWIAPLFPDDAPDAARIRLAACLLGDIAWNAHPDFRAERAVDMAVHGDWVGIDLRERALLGRTLCAAFGGEAAFNPALLALLSVAEADRAGAWGKAIRLAQRLSGGTEDLLGRARVELRGKRELALIITKQHTPLVTEPVERRLKALARSMGREATVEVTG